MNKLGEAISWFGIVTFMAMVFMLGVVGLKRSGILNRLIYCPPLVVERMTEGTQ